MKRYSTVLILVLVLFSVVPVFADSGWSCSWGKDYVFPGQGLAEVAMRNGKTLAGLLVENPELASNPNQVKVWQVVRIWRCHSASANQLTWPVESGDVGVHKYNHVQASKCVGYHQVQPGDTLGAISARYGIPLALLVSANGGTVIYAGHSLCLPQVPSGYRSGP